MHSMREDPEIHCDECGSLMERIPRPFLFGFGANLILGDWSRENLRRVKAGEERFSPGEVNKPHNL